MRMRCREGPRNKRSSTWAPFELGSYYHSLAKAVPLDKDGRLRVDLIREMFHVEDIVVGIVSTDFRVFRTGDGFLHEKGHCKLLRRGDCLSNEEVKWFLRRRNDIFDEITFFGQYFVNKSFISIELRSLFLIEAEHEDWYCDRRHRLRQLLRGSYPHFLIRISLCMTQLCASTAISGFLALSLSKLLPEGTGCKFVSFGAGSMAFLASHARFIVYLQHWYGVDVSWSGLLPSEEHSRSLFYLTEGGPLTEHFL